MSNYDARGIIIKQSDYGEGHRMLSIFTEKDGIIKAVKYGAKSTKNRDSASSQFLCYGDFSLYKGRGDVATVNSVSAIDSFFPVLSDIEKLSLCVYMADLTYSVLGPNNPDQRLLRAFLNCVYALSYRDEACQKVKAVYELRLMSIGGYMPRLDVCSCGSNAICGFDADGGTVVCADCIKKGVLPLSVGTYKALWHICTCEEKKLLSFTGNDQLFAELGTIAEKYALTHLEKNFPSLDYYKAVAQF